MNMPPVKPQVCVLDGKLAVFMAADYKMLDRPAAKKFVRDVQRGYAQLLREEKRTKRAAKMQMKIDGTVHQAWALRDLNATVIDLTTVCESERTANQLLDARRIHQSHRPECKVVSVRLQLTLDADV